MDVLGVAGEGVGVAAVRRPEVDGHHYTRRRTVKLKVISFFKTITKVLDGISGITKNIIFFLFHLRVCERRNFDFLCVLTDV